MQFPREPIPELVVAVAMLLVLSAVPAAAQQHADSLPAAIVVSGTVYDSIANRPLPRALVQLAPSNLTGRMLGSTTDSAGDFIIDGVVPGEYIVGFTHPSLDSLGLEVPAMKLVVAGSASIRLSLAIPSARSIRAQICPTAPGADSSGLMLGFLRDADSGMHLDNGRVVLEWTEVQVSQDGKSIIPQRKTVSAQATRTGWYALCGVPTAGPMAAYAQAGGGTTGFIDVKVPPRGVLHRDFAIPKEAAAVAESPADSSHEDGESEAARIRRGRARVAGVVHDRSGRPLHGASIVVWGSDASTSTDDAGAFSLGGLPAGTHTLEARYVGYAPERTVVNLSSDETRTVNVTLDKIADVLDEVTVYGRESMASRRLAGFRQRMRASASGHFVTRADIKKRSPIRLTDMLEGISGVAVQRSGAFGYRIVKSRPGICTQAIIYVDGHRMVTPNSAARDGISLNDLVWLNWVIGMEVYATGMQAPAEYGGGDDCPRVLVWTSMDADALDRADKGDR